MTRTCPDCSRNWTEHIISWQFDRSWVHAAGPLEPHPSPHLAPPLQKHPACSPWRVEPFFRRLHPNRSNLQFPNGTRDVCLEGIWGSVYCVGAWISVTICNYGIGTRLVFPTLTLSSGTSSPNWKYQPLPTQSEVQPTYPNKQRVAPRTYYVGSRAAALNFWCNRIRTF